MCTPRMILGFRPTMGSVSGDGPDTMLTSMPTYPCSVRPIMEIQTSSIICRVYLRCCHGTLSAIINRMPSYPTTSSRRNANTFTKQLWLESRLWWLNTLEDLHLNPSVVPRASYALGIECIRLCYTQVSLSLLDEACADPQHRKSDLRSTIPSAYGL